MDKNIRDFNKATKAKGICGVGAGVCVAGASAIFLGLDIAEAKGMWGEYSPTQKAILGLSITGCVLGIALGIGTAKSSLKLLTKVKENEEELEKALEE